MSLQVSLQNSLKNATLLKGHKDAIEIEKDKIYQEVEKAKKWLAKKPDYLKFLQHLQHVLHQKNIGIFSELLTYFVKDVLHKDKEIALDLYTYHNLPALRIEAVNNGHRESIYEGNGGSIANIVSTGLRLISLSRMNHRKFIILDEPDCWLAPHHIPLFAKIIGEISQKLKIQTILISHHNWEYFKNYGRVIELKKDGAHLTTEILHDTPVDSYPDDYITEITMKRFMSHYDTTYKLHPYLTCIVGENDIGKSVVGPAIKALSYGDSSDSYIQHNENEAQLLVTLNDNTQLLWQRFLTTSQDNPQKVKFSLFENNVLSKSEFNAHGTPEFIEEKLKIALTEDIDIHIGNQKQPVFLLSSDVKPQERAKILSLGKESLIIQKMMETIKSKTRTFQQVIKEGEAKYDKILKQLKHLTDIELVIIKAEDLSKQYIELENEDIELNKMAEMLPRYESLSLIENIATLNHEIKVPELKDNDYLLTLIEQITYSEPITHIKKVSQLPNEEALNPIEVLKQDINQIIHYSHISSTKSTSTVNNSYELKAVPELKNIINDILAKQKILNLDTVNSVVTPQVADNNPLKQLIEDFEQANTSLADWKIKEDRLEGWKIAIDQEIKEFLSVSGNKCPTCGQHLDINSIKEHLNDRV
jgi:AAA domain